MMWILWVVIAVLWTFVVLIVGYGGGKFQEDKKTKDYDEFHQGPRGVPGPAGATGAMGLSGRDGEPGPPGPGIDEAMIDEHTTLRDWLKAVEDRLRRVERKAGLSV